jgi:hypothetical protein
MQNKLTIPLSLPLFNEMQASSRRAEEPEVLLVLADSRRVLESKQPELPEDLVKSSQKRVDSSKSSEAVSSFFLLLHKDDVNRSRI